MSTKLSLVTIGGKWLLELDSAPNIGPGFTAPKGSEAYVNDGALGSSWLKVGSGDTEWKNISIADTEEVEDVLGNVAQDTASVDVVYDDANNSLKFNFLNPEGYETPVQLNNRDTSNRNRDNHSGQQLASTISNFSASVLASLLSGITFLTNSAIVATDNVLMAFGKIQAQINNHFGSGGSSHSVVTITENGFMSSDDKIKLNSYNIIPLTSDYTNTSNSTLVNLSELSIPVVSGKRYSFRAKLLFDSSSAASGIGLGLSGTASGTLVAQISASISATGTDCVYQAALTALNVYFNSTAVATNTKKYLAIIDGVFIASNGGVIYPQFRSEVNGAQSRVNTGSNIQFTEY